MEVSIRLMESKIFIVHLLGGKVPAFDLLVELIPGPNEIPYQFLIQVKSTNSQNPYTVRMDRIKTKVTNKKLKELVNRPLPSYVAGVNLNTKEIFIAPAFDKNVGYTSSIPTTFKLVYGQKVANKNMLQILKDDVISYWEGLNIYTYKTTFNSRI